MFGAVPHKTKQFFFVLIKLSIVVGAIYFIYNKLSSNKELNINSFIELLSENDHFSLKNITFLLSLSIFNWFFEILKWRYLVSNIKRISFLSALEQSLGSLTASLFTPNRIGEYGVKAMYYKLADAKKVVAINLLSNSLQMAVTVGFGLIGLSLLLFNYELDINYYRIFKISAILIIIVLFPLIGLSKSEFSIKGISIKTARTFYSTIPKTTYFIGFIISMTRYLIFSFQFYFLLTLFDVQLTYLEAMVIITSMYFLSSIIPTLSLFDVVLKGSVAVYLFSIIDINSLTILSIITTMWLLNVVLPSLFGAAFILKFKLPKALT
jgi:hypothetical protein